MTTDVTVRVNGNYIASVARNGEPAINVGPNNMMSFHVPHGTTSNFTVSEAEAPAAEADAPEPEQAATQAKPQDDRAGSEQSAE